MNGFKAKLALVFSAAFIVSAASASSEKINGGAIYEQKCAVCHTEGGGQTPKLDNKSYWHSQVEKGIDKMFREVTNHERHVSCYKCSHREVKEAVKYIASVTSGGNKTLW